MQLVVSYVITDERLDGDRCVMQLVDLTAGEIKYVVNRGHLLADPERVVRAFDAMAKDVCRTANIEVPESETRV